jgi:hypothetical protein
MYLWKGVAMGLLIGVGALVAQYGWHRQEDRRYQRIHEAVDRLEASVIVLERRQAQEGHHAETE